MGRGRGRGRSGTAAPRYVEPLPTDPFMPLPPEVVATRDPGEREVQDAYVAAARQAERARRAYQKAQGRANAAKAVESAAHTGLRDARSALRRAQTRLRAYRARFQQLDALRAATDARLLPLLDQCDRWVRGPIDTKAHGWNAYDRPKGLLLDVIDRLIPLASEVELMKQLRAYLETLEAAFPEPRQSPMASGQQVRTLVWELLLRDVRKGADLRAQRAAALAERVETDVRLDRYLHQLRGRQGVLPAGLLSLRRGPYGKTCRFEWLGIDRTAPLVEGRITLHDLARAYQQGVPISARLAYDSGFVSEAERFDTFAELSVLEPDAPVRRRR